MSIPFWNWAWRQEQLTSIETLLLLSLADMADDAGHSFPGIKMLAKRCRTSERTIQRCIAALKERGLLQVRPRIVEGQQSSNFYTLVADLGAPNAKKGQGDKLSPGVVDVNFCKLDATARIRPRASAERKPRSDLVDLEHARIEASMLPQASPPPAASRRAVASTSAPARDQAPPAWQYPQSALTGVLPQQQPFRDDSRSDTTLAWLPVEDEEKLRPYRVEDVPNMRHQKLFVKADELLHLIPLSSAPGISAWGEFDLTALITEQAESLDRTVDDIAPSFSVVEVPPNENGRGWRWHPWLGFTPQR